MSGREIGDSRNFMAGFFQKKSNGRSDHSGADNGKLKRLFFFIVYFLKFQKKGLPQREEDPYQTVFFAYRLSLLHVIQAVDYFLTYPVIAVK